MSSTLSVDVTTAILHKFLLMSLTQSNLFRFQKFFNLLKSYKKAHILGPVWVRFLVLQVQFGSWIRTLRKIGFSSIPSGVVRILDWGFRDYWTMVKIAIIALNIKVLRTLFQKLRALVETLETCQRHHWDGYVKTTYLHIW